MSNDIDESGTDAAGESTSLNPENERAQENTLPTKNIRNKKKFICIICAIIFTILIITGTCITVYFFLFHEKTITQPINTKINVKLTTSTTITTIKIEPTQTLNQYFLGYMTDERYLDNILTSRLWTKRFDNVKYYVLLFNNGSISIQSQLKNFSVAIETVIHGK